MNEQLRYKLHYLNKLCFIRNIHQIVFFINEGYILISVAILANYFIIDKIRSDRERMEQLKTLTEQIEREKNQKNIIIKSWFKSVYKSFDTWRLKR